VAWRSGLLQGRVHDDNAYWIGGLCGHAGLFGQVQDCLGVGTEWLKAYLGESSYLSQDIAKLFFTPVKAKDGSARALGWDLPSQKDSSAGKNVSKRAVGHLGYTGTSLWLDLERKAVVVLLTNRVHPTAKNEKIKSFRPAFHDLIWEVLDS